MYSIKALFIQILNLFLKLRTRIINFEIKFIFADVVDIFSTGMLGIVLVELNNRDKEISLPYLFNIFHK